MSKSGRTGHWRRFIRSCTFDAIWSKVRESGPVTKVAVYLALGITLAGQKEVLGMWVANSEGAKFWLHVLTELKNRGVRDIFIGCVDGLKGFPEAMEAVFPADPGAVVSGAYGAAFAELCGLEGAQGGGG
jgi:hypothetical protein